MTETVELYWSFRSPYCYLALDRVIALAKRDDVELALRHVWPGAMRRERYFSHLHPNYPTYHRMDTVRLAEQLGVPYGRPRPDPLKFDKETREPAAEQPHIGRLTRMGVLTAEAGSGLAFLDHVMRLIWSGTVDGWDQGPHLSRAIAGAGLDAEDLEARQAAERARLDAEIDANGAALEAAGHWGVPCFVLGGEPFFGQDRLDLLTWRLGQRAAG
ncbi:MAG: DsbA family protein [Magnetovibrio sp.]|nr:DsbA family protein [Magnetovibrio sp.]